MSDVGGAAGLILGLNLWLIIQGIVLISIISYLSHDFMAMTREIFIFSGYTFRVPLFSIFIPRKSTADDE